MTLLTLSGWPCYEIVSVSLHYTLHGRRAPQSDGWRMNLIAVAVPSYECYDSSLPRHHGDVRLTGCSKFEFPIVYQSFNACRECGFSRTIYTFDSHVCFQSNLWQTTIVSGTIFNKCFRTVSHLQFRMANKPFNNKYEQLFNYMIHVTFLFLGRHCMKIHVCIVHSISEHHGPTQRGLKTQNGEIDWARNNDTEMRRRGFVQARGDSIDRWRTRGQPELDDVWNSDISADEFPTTYGNNCSLSARVFGHK